jgi:hypothetical protein
MAKRASGQGAALHVEMAPSARDTLVVLGWLPGDAPGMTVVDVGEVAVDQVEAVLTEALVRLSTYLIEWRQAARGGVTLDSIAEAVS